MVSKTLSREKSGAFLLAKNLKRRGNVWKTIALYISTEHRQNLYIFSKNWKLSSILIDRNYSFCYYISTRLVLVSFLFLGFAKSKLQFPILPLRRIQFQSITVLSRARRIEYQIFLKGRNRYPSYKVSL